MKKNIKTLVALGMMLSTPLYAAEEGEDLPFKAMTQVSKKSEIDTSLSVERLMLDFSEFLEQQPPLFHPNDYQFYTLSDLYSDVEGYFSDKFKNQSINQINQQKHFCYVTYLLIKNYSQNIIKTPGYSNGNRELYDIVEELDPKCRDYYRRAFQKEVS